LKVDHHLKDTDIHLLLDDSGSMFFSKISEKIQKLYKDSKFTRPDGKPITNRFDEALTLIKRILPIIQMVDGTTVTLSFLNSDKVYKAKTNKDDIKQTDKEYKELINATIKLCKLTKGRGTPLVRRTNEIYTDIMNSNRKHLAVLFIDGEPADYGFEAPQKERAFNDLVNIFKKRKLSMFTTIALCTDNEEEVGKFNNLDKKLPRFDVCDDFFSERAEIAEVYYKNDIAMDERMFTYEDYLVKMLIGSMDQEIDRLDELDEIDRLDELDESL